MFVSKAAVVGAGTMGGQIAQTIAAAGIPVCSRTSARSSSRLAWTRPATSPRARSAARRARQAYRRAGRRPDRGDRRAHRRHHLLRGLRRRRLRDRGGPRADGHQAGRVRRARRLYARPRDPRLEHLLAVDHRDRRSDAAARQGRRLSLLLSRLGHAAGRDRRRRGDLAGDGHRGGHLRSGDPQAADHLRRGSGLRRQPDPHLRHLGDLARAGGGGPVDQAHR